MIRYFFVLIIETGEGVPNANTFIDDAFYVSYAAARGLIIGADEAAREIELILSIDYINSIESRLKGTRVKSEQSLPYPRNNVTIFGKIFSSSSIPIQLKNAQAEGSAAANSQSLLTNESNKNIKLRKLDVLETEFFKGGSWSVTRLERVDSAIKELLISGGGFGRVARTL